MAGRLARHRPDAGAHFLNAVGRLKPGVSPAQAAADFNVIAERLAQQFPNTNQGWRIAIQTAARRDRRARRERRCWCFSARSSLSC